MLLYAIRHAESAANAEGVGGMDTPLSPLGHRQAEALAARLSRLKPAALYSSPYQRCLSTAAAISRSINCPVRIRPELCEFHPPLGKTPPSGKLPTMEELLASRSDVMACPDVETMGPWPPIDESFEALVGRIRAFAEFVKRRWTGAADEVVVVSHGSPIARLIEAWISDAPGRSFRFIIDNAALAALRFDQGVSSLVCMNEVSHLRGLAAPAAANYTADGGIKAQAPANYW